MMKNKKYIVVLFDKKDLYKLPKRLLGKYISSSVFDSVGATLLDALNDNYGPIIFKVRGDFNKIKKTIIEWDYVADLMNHKRKDGNNLGYQKKWFKKAITVEEFINEISK
jgi:hypothetical protein